MPPRTKSPSKGSASNASSASKSPSTRSPVLISTSTGPLSTGPLLSSHLEDVGGDTRDNENEEAVKFVLQAKKTLESYVNAKNDADESATYAKIGRCEGLFNILQLANFKVDDNNRMSEEDMERFRKENNDRIDTQLSALQNSLIVTVLVLSIIYPIAYHIDLPSDPLLGQYVEYIVMQIAVFCCVVSLYMSSLMYLQLAFFLPTANLKTWYIEEVQHLRPTIEASKNIALFCSFLGLFIRQLWFSKNYINVFGSLPFLGLISVDYYFFYHTLGKIKSKMKAYGKQLLGNKLDDPNTAHELQNCINKSNQVDNCKSISFHLLNNWNSQRAARTSTRTGRREVRKKYTLFS